ncbi:hypothetical protein [Methylophaga sp. OBS4]|uniref:hypothetical protein n=1 Tax=Methylophaga sp. OBS4 TaxID=2991935 RepID=UPI002259CB0A|nr:hypothetical protein [Methylophaga sp. OBS4]MCX4186607.1 hypothetical protein [Methylophaga sp. OBS4]
MDALISLIGDLLSSLFHSIPTDLASWKDLAVIIRDIAVGFSAVYAIFFGAKKLKAYLDEDLKQRIKETRSSNKSTNELAVLLIEELEEKNLKQKDIRPITEVDIASFRELTKDLTERAINANDTTQTLIFLLRRVLIDLQVSFEKDEFKEKIVLSDINRFIYFVLIEVMHDTSNILEIPKTSKAKNIGLKSTFEYSTGVTLKHDSKNIEKFYRLTEMSRNVFLIQSMLVHLGSNYPVFKMLQRCRVYVPLLLCVKYNEMDILASRPALHLIRVSLERKKFFIFTYYKAVQASYAPISRNVVYLQDRKAVEAHKDQFYDPIFNEKADPKFFKDFVIKGKQIVNIKLQPEHSKFLWGYKNYALKRWVQKNVYTNNL